MANWEGTTQGTSIDTQAAATVNMEARNSTRSGASYGDIRDFAGPVGQFLYDAGSFLGIIKDYSIVGIDATKVPQMRQQIRDSVTALQTHLDGIEAQANSSNAFRSEEIKTAVENYVDAIKDYCKALISDLLAFSDKLQEVREAWEQSTQNFASDSIGSSRESLAGASEYYQEVMPD